MTRLSLSAALLARRTEYGNYQRTAVTIIQLTYFHVIMIIICKLTLKSSVLTRTREVCNPALSTVPAYILQR